MSQGAACFRNGLPKTFRTICLACVPVLILSAWCFARSHDDSPAAFSIDLDKPFEAVLDAVREVALNGVIRGTFEYQGEDSLPGAQTEQSSRLFPPLNGPGQVFYKVRYKALAPAHFLKSNDVGTVAVRYVVQEMGPNSTRLLIDAFFVENARHHNHPSDGFVETSEFGVIGKALKSLEQEQALAAAKASHPGESSSRDREPQVAVVEPSGTGNLQEAIAEEKVKLEEDNAKLGQLEDQAQQLKQPSLARVSAERAELKALPYAHSQVVASVKQGDEVTLLLKSAYWYRVRTADGHEGWIHHGLLEPGL